MKRVRLEEGAAEGGDRSWFWSGEQNRWVDLISTWIRKKERFSTTSVLEFQLSAKGDVCMPRTLDPLLKGWKSNVCVGINIVLPAPLWTELASGWRMFATEVMAAVMTRCDLESACPVKTKTKDHCKCTESTEDGSAAWSRICAVKKSK